MRLKQFSVSRKPPKCYICFPKPEGQTQKNYVSNTLEITKFGSNLLQEDFNSASSEERK